MTHPTLDQLWLLHHEALDDAEAAPVRAHLESPCEACRARVAAIEHSAATLALGADPREPGPEVRERLVAAVGARPGEGSRPMRPGLRALPLGLPIAAGLVCVGIALGAATTWFAAAERAADAAHSELALALARAEAAPPRVPETLLDERDALREELAEERAAHLASRARVEQLEREQRGLDQALAEATRARSENARTAARLADERDRLDQALSAAEAALALLQSPGVEWVVLSSEDQEAASAARFFWEGDDRDHCLIDGGQLPEIGEGEIYALWVVYERGDPALVATFAPDANGSARIVAPLPEGDGEVRAVRVTVEKAARPAAPAGQTLLAGVLF